MTIVPATSITMLKDISNDADSVRWNEFFRKYEAPMRGYLYKYFPRVDQDDAIQETLVALAKALPDYRYTPDKNRHFRNYLMGILRHKAIDAIRREAAQNAMKNAMSARKPEPERNGTAADNQDEDDSWRRSAMEAALEQLFADDSIQPRTREVFRHAAIMHEPPEKVAAQFGITRNNVDQIKNRMIARLAKLVKAMTA